MIKHLTPRTKSEIRIAKFLAIFDWRNFKYTEFYHKTRDLFSLKWHWVRSSYLAQNQIDWIKHYNSVSQNFYSFKNIPNYHPVYRYPVYNIVNIFDSETDIIKSGLIWKETYDYEYNNEKTKATIWVVEREWERRWWLSGKNREDKRKGVRLKKNFIEKQIEIQFNPPLLCVCRCDYVMKKNETPLEALRRMEKNRIFR